MFGQTVAVNCFNVFALSEQTISDDYSTIPRSTSANKEEIRLAKVVQFLDDLLRPIGMTDSEYDTFVRYHMRFFVQSGKLWRRDPNGMHKVVVQRDRRLAILHECHDDLGHKGFFATRALIMERFWWPHIHEDLKWFIRSCHWCQERQLRQIRVPPVVAEPTPIFVKVYLDTMHLPTSSGFKYIIQARCSLTHYPEHKALRQETARTVGEWVYEDLLCRWGALSEIVTDNGTAIIWACTYLAKKYKINHIRISGYNSRANGIVE